MTDTYTRQLAAQLENVTELRIPSPLGRCDDLIVRRRDDGHADGWAVLDLLDHTWTGTRWLSTTVLTRSETYHYTDRQTAVDTATRLVHDTATLTTRLHGDREKRPAT